MSYSSSFIIDRERAAVAEKNEAELRANPIKFLAKNPNAREILTPAALLGGAVIAGLAWWATSGSSGSQKKEG